MLRALALALVAVVAIPATAVARPTDADRAVPLPRGSRSVGDEIVVVSGTSFRRTVAFYRRWLAREGTAHRAIPVYQRGDTVVARFLSEAPRSAWLAVHVFRQDGRTRIAVIPRPAPSP